MINLLQQGLHVNEWVEQHYWTMVEALMRAKDYTKREKLAQRARHDKQAPVRDCDSSVLATSSSLEKQNSGCIFPLPNQPMQADLCMKWNHSSGDGARRHVNRSQVTGWTVLDFIYIGHPEEKSPCLEPKQGRPRPTQGRWQTTVEGAGNRQLAYTQCRDIFFIKSPGGGGGIWDCGPFFGQILDLFLKIVDLSVCRRVQSAGILIKRSTIVDLSVHYMAQRSRYLTKHPKKV